MTGDEGQLFPWPTTPKPTKHIEEPLVVAISDHTSLIATTRGRPVAHRHVTVSPRATEHNGRVRGAGTAIAPCGATGHAVDVPAGTLAPQCPKCAAAS